MTPSSVERNLRARLPITRFFQNYIPLPVARWLIKQGMARVRLAAEAHKAVSVDDCITAYRWLLKQGFSAQNIVVAGDSAGGNLTITMMMKLRDSGDPLPAADLSDRSNRLKGFKDPLLPPRAVRMYNKSYVAHNDPRMWHVWQLYLTLPQAVQSLDDIARFLKSHLPPNANC